MTSNKTRTSLIPLMDVYYSNAYKLTHVSSTTLVAATVTKDSKPNLPIFKNIWCWGVLVFIVYSKWRVSFELIYIIHLSNTYFLRGLCPSDPFFYDATLGHY